MSGHANFAPIGHNLPPVQGGVPGPAAPQPAPQPQPPAEVEAAVRAECVQKGIVNEEEIERRISSKVEMILFSKEGEIAPSRQLTADLLDLGFGMMHEGLPAVGRDPETGFLAAFAVYPCSRLVAAEFPGSFEKFVSFAMRLADRLETERAAGHASPAPAPEAPPPPAHGSHGFLQV